MRMPGPIKTRVAHVPDVRTFDGILDLFSLCNILEMSNIIHFQTYLSPGLSVTERMGMIQGRKRTREVLGWLFNNYGLDGDLSLREVFWKYLTIQLEALRCGKAQAEKNRVYSFEPKLIARHVSAAINNCFRPFPYFSKFSAQLQLEDRRANFAWPVGLRYNVVMRDMDMLERLEDGGMSHDFIQSRCPLLTTSLH